MNTVVGSGRYTYQVDDDWAKLPAGWAMPAAAVTVDSRDRVYCFNRTPDHPIVVFDREGNYLSSWGAGLFAFPHTIRVDEHDNVWIVDRDHGQMLHYTSDGTLLRTIGTRGHRSDTGVDPMDFNSSAYRNVTHGGGPFNLPTDIALTPSGEMFMTDGYGNARVHKFAADGTHLFSWGEPGTGPGQFSLPHGVWIDTRGRVLVCDRENDRVQVFDQAGKFLHVWTSGLLRGRRRHRLHSRAQRWAGQCLDPRGRATGAVGRPELSLVPRHLGRLPRRSVRRAAGGVGTSPACCEVHAPAVTHGGHQLSRSRRIQLTTKLTCRGRW